MSIYVIIGIGVTVAIVVLILSRRGKSKSLPAPAPIPQPIPEPAPPPPPEPPPIIEPPVELALPVSPDVGEPNPPPEPFPRYQQAYIGSVSDIGQAIMDLQLLGIQEIVVTRSGELLTPVILGHGRRLRIESGVTIISRTAHIPFRLTQNTSIIGGQDSVIMESDAPGQFTVISGFYGSERNGAPDFDITLYGFEVRGSNRSDFNSAPQAVALGNCKKFSVEKVWINGTHSIGIQAGGAGFDGHAAEDGKVRHCRFTRVASQSLALVNGRRIIYEFNKFDSPGQFGGPGSHPIDLELNGFDDVLYDIKIRSNWIDMREALVNGNGIICQASTGSQEIGRIEIDDNVLLGGNPYPPVTNWMSNGLYVYGPTMRGVKLRRNKVWRTGQHGAWLQGEDIIATDNEFVDCGGGGLPGGKLEHMTGEFSRNSYRWTGHGPADSRLLVIGARPKMDNNPGFQVVEEI